MKKLNEQRVSGQGEFPCIISNSNQIQIFEPFKQLMKDYKLRYIKEYECASSKLRTTSVSITQCVYVHAHAFVFDSLELCHFTNLHKGEKFTTHNMPKTAHTLHTLFTTSPAMSKNVH